MNFPKHDASLTLTHNEHKNYYKTVIQAIEDEDFGYRDWVSDEEKVKAMIGNDCWYIQWYPDTLVGFCIMAASDLKVLLNYVNKE